MGRYLGGNDFPHLEELGPWSAVLERPCKGALAIDIKFGNYQTSRCRS